MNLMAQNSTHSYGINARKATQLMVAGFFATLAMVAVGYLLQVFGFPTTDLPALYGSILNGQSIPEQTSTLWWAGFAWHLINGAIIFALAYDFLADRVILPNARWAKGAIWGATLWLLVEAIVKPFGGMGFFSSAMTYPLSMVTTNLIQWMVYGVVLEAMTRVRTVHALGIASDRKAA